MTDQNEIIARGNCFKLLAACFYEPDKAMFIEHQVCENLQNLSDSLSSDAANHAGKMDMYLKTLSQEKLSIDHAALFVGPFELLAAPYGSVYTEDTRQVMGKSTIDVLSFYETAGLSVEIQEPPDHIAIELEFMYYLCAKEATAVNDKKSADADGLRKQQIDFYFSALKPWAAKFCEAIRAGIDNGFYINLADCLEHFLASCEQIYSLEYAVKTG
jgi:TorA maturation chaperone TorD